jgi:glycosyltransferase involved in cell wall biosynthesis
MSDPSAPPPDPPAPPPEPPEPVSVVLPVRNAADRLGPAVRDWHAALSGIGRGFELLIVDDGSTDGTAEIADALASELPDVRVLRHPAYRGFGACLRSALPETRHPLFFYAALDYPYTPADLGPMLERIGHRDEYMNRRIDLVSGCRTGRPTPWVWVASGKLVRGFARVALGLPLDPLPAWPGLREVLRSWLVWAVFGDPLCDPNSAFKLFRKALFDKFPVQSDGDFVHVELVAKATFVTALIDELPLTPKPDRGPPTWWGEFWKVIRDPQFTPQESKELATDEARMKHGSEELKV